MYLDANNLYGGAMVEKLPVRNMHWHENLEIFTTENILNIDSNGDIGFILDVDLEYP